MASLSQLNRLMLGPHNSRRLLLVALTLGMPVRSMAQNNANAMVQRSVEGLKRDFEASPQFDCLERDRVTGGLKPTKTP